MQAVPQRALCVRPMERWMQGTRTCASQLEFGLFWICTPVSTSGQSSFDAAENAPIGFRGRP